MELSQYVAMLRRWWWLLALSGPAGAILALYLTSLVTPQYESTVTLLVDERSEVTSERLLVTFAQLVTVQPVMENAAAKLDGLLSPEELPAHLSVSHPTGTQLLWISARSDEPAEAQVVANIVAESFVEANEAGLAGRPGVVAIVDRARLPRVQVSPRPAQNAALGFMLSGLVLSGLLMTYTYLDDTVRTPLEASELTGLTTLGVVGRFKRPSSAPQQIHVRETDSPVAEAFRSTRTALTYAMGSPTEPMVLLFSSPRAGDGKTTTLANLGVAFAMAGRRVLLVDADMRNPTLHQVFSVGNGAGLSTFAAGQAESHREVVRPTAYEDVSILPSGPLPPNRSELLGSTRVAELFESVRQDYDVILVDTPPVLAATDASVLAGIADLSILVVNASKTGSKELQAATANLAQSNRPIAGLVLNRAKPGAEGVQRVPYAVEPAAGGGLDAES